MNLSTAQATAGPVCTTCQKTPSGFFRRYQGFLLAPGTIIACVNAGLMIAGFVAEFAGQAIAARWLFAASAIIGGAPIFKLAAVSVWTRFDLTAGVMVSIAMIAAMVVGEYSAAALVAFMMLVGEMLENFTIARADNALNELESLVPATVVLRQEGRDVETAGYPMHMAELLGGLPGVAYVTRGHVTDVSGIRRAKKAIKMAFRAQMEGLGFSMVEMLSTCYTNWGLTISDAMKWVQEYMIPHYPLGDTCVSEAMKGWR